MYLKDLIILGLYRYRCDFIPCLPGSIDTDVTGHIEPCMSVSDKFFGLHLLIKASQPTDDWPLSESNLL